MASPANAAFCDSDEFEAIDRAALCRIAKHAVIDVAPATRAAMAPPTETLRRLLFAQQPALSGPCATVVANDEDAAETVRLARRIEATNDAARLVFAESVSSMCPK